MNLNTPITELVGIGPSYRFKLEKMGIETIEDLLLYLPRRWDDYSKVLPIARVRAGEAVSIKGRISKISSHRAKSGLNVTEATIRDETGEVKAIWFNQPFLVNAFKEDEEYYFAGKIEWNGGKFSFVSPVYEKVIAEEGEEVLSHTAGIIPVYPEIEGVTSRWLRARIKPMMKYIYSIKDYLPESVKRDQNLMDLPAAIRQMHFPENEILLKKAKERLNFDEMFLLQTAVLNARKILDKEKAIAVPFSEELSKNFVQKLGYDLTGAQRKAAWEILQDLGKPNPMNRLLQGDVGSGKTVVAALVMANVAASGSQSVLLCPTEILAKQHFAKISQMLEGLGFEVALLTGSTPKSERDNILAKLYEGEIKILIGTHAVLDKNIVFWRLALAIVDEQHRFGVSQRNSLRKESSNTGTLPHFLSMTATPIPRTLTLTLYGDLDVAILNEMPPGRQKVITKLVPEKIREETYKFIESEIKAGRQAFIVCPLIGEEQDKTVADFAEDERKSVLSENDRLLIRFPAFKVAYLHGKMPQSEKDRIMTDFWDNKIQILVSTSVVEVGIDIPNASIMIIEDAERFGLSQLHQFRGRVGRGHYQSYCFLFTKSSNEETTKRLAAITNTADGFKLAEVDLEIRGPGDFIGVKQHGLPEVKLKHLTNAILIKKAREAARKFLSSNEIDNYPLLYQKVRNFEGVLHLE